MSREIKVLGLALVAVLVAGSLTAASAFAVQLHFKAAVYPVKVTGKGTNTHIFKIGTVTVECTTSEFGPTAEILGETTEITIPAKYSNCKAFGFANATINMKTCEFTFHIGEELKNNMVDVVCKTIGDKIQITAALTTCEVTVAEQLGLTAIEYVNLAGSPTKVEVKPNVVKIKYEVAKEGTGCPLNNMEEATYTGNAVAEGFSQNALKEFKVADNIEVS